MSYINYHNNAPYNHVPCNAPYNNPYGRAPFNPVANTQFTSPGNTGMPFDFTLAQIFANCQTWVDTCWILGASNTAQVPMLTNLERLSDSGQLRNCFVPMEVLIELDEIASGRRPVRDRDGKPDQDAVFRARRAKGAIEKYCHLGQMHLVKATTSDTFADHALVKNLVETRRQSDRPVCLLTRDSNLATSVLALNNLRYTSGQAIGVYRLSMKGTVTRFVVTDPEKLKPLNDDILGEATPPQGNYPNYPNYPNGYGSQPAVPTPHGAYNAMQGTPSPQMAYNHGSGNGAAPNPQGGYNARHGQRADSRETRTASTVKDQLTTVPDEELEVKSVPSTGSELTGYADGRKYKLGKAIGQGAEATVYEVEGGLAAKIFVKPTRRKEAKLHVLLELAQKGTVSGVALPVDLLLQDGVFVGYVMPKIDGVALADLFRASTRKEIGCKWQRYEFVVSAETFLTILRDLNKEGVHVADYNPGNLIVGRDIDGNLSPSSLTLIDVDSAQIDVYEGGVDASIPADGIAPEYSSPELISVPFTKDRLISEAEQVFGAALLAAQMLLCGMHAFKTCRDLDLCDDRSLAGAIQRGGFPYGVGKAGAIMGDGEQPSELGKRLFSYMPRGMKDLLTKLFSATGEYHAVDARPTLEQLESQVTYFKGWIHMADTIRRFPEANSLSPVNDRPLWARCSATGCRNSTVDMPVAEAAKEGSVAKVGMSFLCWDCYQRSKRPAATAGGAFI